MRWISSTGAGVLSFYSLGDGVQHVLPFLPEEVNEDEIAVRYSPCSSPLGRADVASPGSPLNFSSSPPTPAGDAELQALRPKPVGLFAGEAAGAAGLGRREREPVASSPSQDAVPPSEHRAASGGQRGASEETPGSSAAGRLPRWAIRKAPSLGYVTTCIFSGGWGGYDESEVTFGTTEGCVAALPALWPKAAPCESHRLARCKGEQPRGNRQSSRAGGSSQDGEGRGDFHPFPSSHVACPARRRVSLPYTIQHLQMLGVHTPSLAASYHAELFDQGFNVPSAADGRHPQGCKVSQNSCCCWPSSNESRIETRSCCGACVSCCCESPPPLALDRGPRSALFACSAERVFLPSLEASLPGFSSALASRGGCCCSAVRRFFSSDRLLLALDKGGNGVVCQWSSVPAEAEGGGEAPTGGESTDDPYSPPSSFFSLNLPIHRSESNPIITPLLAIVPASTGSTRLLSVYDLVTSSFVFYARPPASPKDGRAVGCVSSPSPLLLRPPRSAAEGDALAGFVASSTPVSGRRHKLWTCAVGDGGGSGPGSPGSALAQASSRLCISGTAWLPALHPLLLAASSTDGNLLVYDLRASPHPCVVAQHPRASEGGATPRPCVPCAGPLEPSSSSTRRSAPPRGQASGSPPPKKLLLLQADTAPSPSSPSPPAPATPSGRVPPNASGGRPPRPFSFITSAPWLTSAAVAHEASILPCTCCCCMARASSLQGAPPPHSATPCSAPSSGAPAPPRSSRSHLEPSQASPQPPAESEAAERGTEDTETPAPPQAGRRAEGGAERASRQGAVKLHGGRAERGACIDSESAAPVFDGVAAGHRGDLPSEGTATTDGQENTSVEGFRSVTGRPHPSEFGAGGDPLSVFTGCDAAIIFKPRNCRRPRPPARSSRSADCVSSPRADKQASSLVVLAQASGSAPEQACRRKEQEADQRRLNSAPASASRQDSAGGLRGTDDGPSKSRRQAAEAPDQMRERLGTELTASGAECTQGDDVASTSNSLCSSSQPPLRDCMGAGKSTPTPPGGSNAAGGSPTPERLAQNEEWKACWFSQEQRRFLRFASRRILGEAEAEPSSQPLHASVETSPTCSTDSHAPSHRLFRAPPESSASAALHERTHEIEEDFRSLSSAVSSAGGAAARGHHPLADRTDTFAICFLASLDQALFRGMPTAAESPAVEHTALAVAAALLRISASPCSVFTSFPDFSCLPLAAVQPRSRVDFTALQALAKSAADDAHPSPADAGARTRALVMRFLSAAAAAALSNLRLSHRLDQHMVMAQLAGHQQVQLLKLLHSRMPHPRRPLTPERVEEIARSLARLLRLLRGQEERPHPNRGAAEGAFCSATRGRKLKRRKQETPHQEADQEKIDTDSTAALERLQQPDGGAQQSSGASTNPVRVVDGEGSQLSPAFVSRVARLYAQLLVAGAWADGEEKKEGESGGEAPAARAKGERGTAYSRDADSGLSKPLHDEKGSQADVESAQTYFQRNFEILHYRNALQVLRYAASALFVFGDAPYLLDREGGEPLSAASQAIRAAVLACSPCPPQKRNWQGLPRGTAPGSEKAGESSRQPGNAEPTPLRSARSGQGHLGNPGVHCSACAGDESAVKTKMRRWLAEELERDIRGVFRLGQQEKERDADTRLERKARRAGIRALAETAVASLCMCELFLPTSFFPSVLFSALRMTGAADGAPIQRNCMRVLPVSDQVFHSLAQAQRLQLRTLGSPNLSSAFLASRARRKLVEGALKPALAGQERFLRPLLQSAASCSAPPVASIASTAGQARTLSPSADSLRTPSAAGGTLPNVGSGGAASPAQRSALGGLTGRRELQGRTLRVKGETRSQQLFCVDARGHVCVLTVSLLVMPPGASPNPTEAGNPSAQDVCPQRRLDSPQEPREPSGACGRRLGAVVPETQAAARQASRGSSESPPNRSLRAKLKNSGPTAEQTENAVREERLRVRREIDELVKGDGEDGEDGEQQDTRIIFSASVDAGKDKHLERTLRRETCAACCGAARGEAAVPRPRRLVAGRQPPGERTGFFRDPYALDPAQQALECRGDDEPQPSDGPISRGGSGRKGKAHEKQSARGPAKSQSHATLQENSDSTPPCSAMGAARFGQEQASGSLADAFLDKLPLLPVWRFPRRSSESGESLLVPSSSSSSSATHAGGVAESPSNAHESVALPSSSQPTASGAPAHDRETASPGAQGRGKARKAPKCTAVPQQEADASLVVAAAAQMPRLFVAVEEDICFSVRGRSSRGAGCGGAQSSRVASLAVHENASYVFLATSAPSFLLYTSSAALPPYRHHDRLVFGSALAAHSASSLFHPVTAGAARGVRGSSPEVPSEPSSRAASACEAVSRGGCDACPFSVAFVLPDAPRGPRPPPPLLLSASPLLPSYPPPPFLPPSLVRPSAESSATLGSACFAGGAGKKAAGGRGSACCAGGHVHGAKKGREDRKETVFSDWLTEDEDDFLSNESDEEARGSDD
ncbi:hypothetical protein BESB_076000 [Besnoitia besnoiti]|uniref:Uncharacterized protein n=1 Tax=Besnoitia besnoiti TaxID=94643 RepID=A0A2A9MCJ7_BESBE|nr:hypothetical protein BESB_076000 [Besnoitia besnoiti]PFH33383.1 hypothetical protein BESB_076000 [Besnoitia besnoiti]